MTSQEYETFLKAAAADICEQGGSEVDKLINVYVRAVARTLSDDAKPATIMFDGHDAETVRADLEKEVASFAPAVVAEEVPPVTADDLSFVWENLGETLADRGADYSLEFVRWMRDNEPAIFAKMEQEDPEWENGGDHELVMFIYENECLGGSRQSKIFAAFCATCPKARKHVLDWKMSLKSD